MPAKSGAQYRFFQAVAHGTNKKNKGKRRGMGGLSKEQAREMIKKTPKKKRSMFARAKY